MVPFSIEDKLFYSPSQREKMPIITPAFPSMNSTYNVSESTKHVLLTELEKGAVITEALVNRQPGVSWKRLFKKLSFFRAYQHFIQVSIVSRKENDHKTWLGFAETKIKKVVQALEKFDSL